MQTPTSSTMQLGLAIAALLPFSCHALFNFGDSGIIYNNLGGLGPVTMDPEELRYSNLTMLNLPDGVDLVITNLTAYQADVNPGQGIINNGLNGQFGSINVLTNTSTTLQFCFEMDGMNFTMDKFVITWFDLDNHPQGNRQESVTICEPFVEAMTSMNTTVLEEVLMDGKVKFTSDVAGDIGDNPSDPMNLTQLQLDRAVAVEYADVSCFIVLLEVEAPPTIYGRNFLFGGESSLLPLPLSTPTPAPMPMVATIKSDPHFRGLDGSFFDFDGNANEKYALLVNKEDGIEMIAGFGTAYTVGFSMPTSSKVPVGYKPKGTWLASVAICITDPEDRSSKATLVVAGDKNSSPSDEELEYGSVLLVNDSKDSSSLLTYTISNQGKTVVYTSKILTGKIHIVPPPGTWGVSAEKSHELTHINVDIDRLDVGNLHSFEGILGASAQGYHADNADAESYEAHQFVDERLLRMLP